MSLFVCGIGVHVVCSEHPSESPSSWKRFSHAFGPIPIFDLTLLGVSSIIKSNFNKKGLLKPVAVFWTIMSL